MRRAALAALGVAGIAAAVLAASYLADPRTTGYGIEAVDRARHPDGCLPLLGAVCPMRVELPIRPLTRGTLRLWSTFAAHATLSPVCCYDWETLGNR